MNHLSILWSGLWRLLLVTIAFLGLFTLFHFDALIAILILFTIGFLAAAYGLGVLVHADITYHREFKRDYGEDDRKSN
jgi:hypothetical protein